MPACNHCLTSDTISSIFLQTIGDVFVHHFSPENLPPIRKSVAFVIDVSGSMFGKKLRQTKAALITILGQMRPNDRFNIIPFSDQVFYWQEARLVTATENNIDQATGYINNLQDMTGKYRTFNMFNATAI